MVLNRTAMFVVALLAAFFLCMLPLRAEDKAFRAFDYKMAGDQQYTRIVMHFDRDPGAKWFLLRDPYRLVLDLPKTAFAFDQRELEARGLVSAVQYGALDEKRARIVFRAVGPFAIEAVETVKNENSEGYRLMIGLKAASRKDFDLALRGSMGGADASAAQAPVDAAPQDERFTVVLDAGHGGADGGARGINGTVEKTITLLFALELKKKLEETDRYKVVLTRDADRFLRLDQRVRIAREHDADLFISIHADAIGLRNMRGATVYTVSDKASDAEAAATAARENLSDEIAGMVVEERKDEVEDILVELIRRETHAFSIRFARNLVGELSHTLHMVNNPHRYAGFRVLRAPDIPSVLLELGYLSNEKDEAQLRDPVWRAKTMDAIVTAIGYFAKARAGAGG